MGKNETNGPEQKLTPREANLVAALLTGCTVRAAARTCGLSEKSAFNYLNMAHVRKALDEGTAKIMQNALSQSQLMLIASAAVDTLQEISLDTEAPASARVQAARYLAARILDVKPVEAETAAAPGIDWSVFSESQLAIIEPVFRSIEEQKKQA